MAKLKPLLGKVSAINDDSSDTTVTIQRIAWSELPVKFQDTVAITRRAWVPLYLDRFTLYHSRSVG
jgi:hypothetical protein